jgi:hypothetical protein
MDDDRWGAGEDEDWPERLQERADATAAIFEQARSPDPRAVEPASAGRGRDPR